MIIFDSSNSSLKTQMPAKAISITSHVSPWLAQLVYPLGCYIVLPFYFRSIEVIGNENIPREGPVILAPTHRSRWDSQLLPYSTGRYATGRDLRFMVSVNEVKGLQGWFIRRLGGFPVDPKHPAISTLRHGVEILCDKQMLVIFPEGAIYQDNQVHPLKVGLARLAIQAESNHPDLGVKIVPMSIRYHPCIPCWRSTVKITIGTPLSAGNYLTGSGKKDAQTLTDDLEIALNKIDRD
ncbi:acyltransferase [Oscillatoriales cyanobacterium USR001]|nr:acyltransferase [Oscillatoriales cyanobacterium USR001]